MGVEMASLAREHFRKSIPICRSNECGHWGSCPKTGNVGCLMLRQKKGQCPGKIDVHLIGGNGCLADRPLFGAVELPTRVTPIVKPAKPIAPQLTARDVSSFKANDPGSDTVQVLTCHYNPQRFARLRDTYYEWLPTLGAIADRLTCYEMVLDDDQPEIEGSVVIRGTRSANAMWQKEALLNIGLDRLDSNVKYVVWSDHDIVFSDPNWLGKAISLVTDATPAVQLFEEIRYADKDLKHRGSVSSCTTVGRNRGKCNPGAAWLADAAWLRSVRFPTDHIVGGGDAYWLGKHRRQCTTLPGVVTHLWHGDMKYRQHSTRESILRKHQFDPKRDTRIAANGLLEWATGKPQLHADVLRFFESRREDG